MTSWHGCKTCYSCGRAMNTVCMLKFHELRDKTNCNGQKISEVRSLKVIHECVWYRRKKENPIVMPLLNSSNFRERLKPTTHLFWKKNQTFFRVRKDFIAVSWISLRFYFLVSFYHGVWWISSRAPRNIFPQFCRRFELLWYGTVRSFTSKRPICPDSTTSIKEWKNRLQPLPFMLGRS